MRNLVIISILLAASHSADADSILIKNVDVYSSGGVEKATNVLINNGVITRINHQIFQRGDREIDGYGKSVTAGLFNSSTHIGTVEVSAIGATVDSYSRNESITASLKITEAFNPNSTLIPHNRTHGLTHALIVPDSIRACVKP